MEISGAAFSAQLSLFCLKVAADSFLSQKLSFDSKTINSS